MILSKFFSCMSSKNKFLDRHQYLFCLFSIKVIFNKAYHLTKLGHNKHILNILLRNIALAAFYLKDAGIPSMPTLLNCRYEKASIKVAQRGLFLLEQQTIVLGDLQVGT